MGNKLCIILFIFSILSLSLHIAVIATVLYYLPHVMCMGMFFILSKSLYINKEYYGKRYLLPKSHQNLL